MKTIEFPEILDLFNPLSGKRYGMRLKREMPVESAKGVEPGGTARILDHMISCEGAEAVVLLGVEAVADRLVGGTKIRVLLDGEEVLRGVLKEESSMVVGEFLPTQCLFLAEIPNGPKVGMFMVNGTQIHVSAGIPRRSGHEVTVQAKLRMALYEAIDAPKS